MTNANINSNSKVLNPNVQGASDYLPAFQKLLSTALSDPDPDFAYNLCRIAEIVEWQLGDQITTYSASSVSNPTENSVHPEPEPDEINLVLQGRVRLLAFDPKPERDVCVSVLEEGEIFGGDHHWYTPNEPLSYQAIAASEVVIARLTLSKIQERLNQPLVNQLSNLQDYLKTTTKQRQQLIFFKTQTELRRYTSYQLRDTIPHLIEHQISAGTSLKKATPEGSGRYWLYQGQIKGGEQTVTIGESWGDPDATPPKWLAQTDLQIYQLPAEQWAALSQGQIKGVKPKQLKQQLPSNVTRLEPKQQPSLGVVSPAKKGSSQVIAFPKPSKRHRFKGFWKRYPFIEQQSSSDCGAACLGMISKYWGKYFGINTLRNLAAVGRSGASLKSLSKAAEHLGFQARPVRASLSRIETQKNPWVAHWQGDHYIVVYRVKGKKVLVADPALGKRELSRADFLTGWTGYALLLDPTDRLYETPNEKRSLGQFIKLLWPYRFIGLQIIVVSILIQLFGLVSPMFTQIILDQVVVTKSQSTLNVFVLGAFLFGIWGMILGSVRGYLLSYFSNRLDLTMITGFISHALSLPLKFFESRRVGDIITRVQENQKIQRFMIGQVMLSWLNFVTGFIYLGLMLYYNWKLTMLVLCLIPQIVIFTLAVTPLLRKLSRERFQAAADQNSSLVEMMTGVSTVKAVAAERDLRWRWEDLLTHQLNVRFKGQKLAINLGMINGLVNSIGGTALMWYGASLVISGELSIGQYVAFNMMKGHIISPVIALAGLWDELQEVFISVERLNDVFETEPEETPDKPLMVLPNIAGHVRLEDVTFRYSDDAEGNVLQNISFDVKAGQTIALVGRSGSGKSTLVKLLQGLYYPTSGRIWIDGHDICHISPQSLRSQMGVVPQDCYLFSGTIAENITIYRDEFPLEQVVEMAKLAEAHSFVQSFPLGYNTKVGERGSSLSGGQRQRVAIARALLGNPRILVLDEATSSLDTESERRFQQNLEQVSRNRTTFIIAHRLSTVRNADQILVLDRGVLAEQGNHEELMKLEGLYYHLAQQQLNL